MGKGVIITGGAIRRGLTRRLTAPQAGLQCPADCARTDHADKDLHERCRRDADAISVVTPFLPETERNGRLGSFVFSIGPVRNNAHQTSVNVLLKVVVGIEITQLVESMLSANVGIEGGSALRDLFHRLSPMPTSNISAVDAETLTQKWKLRCHQRLDPKHYRQLDDLTILNEIAADMLKAIPVLPDVVLVRRLVKCGYALCMIMAVQDLCDLVKGNNRRFA